jgi:polyphosphate kinase
MPAAPRPTAPAPRRPGTDAGAPDSPEDDEAGPAQQHSTADQGTGGDGIAADDPAPAGAGARTAGATPHRPARTPRRSARPRPADMPTIDGILPEPADAGELSATPGGAGLPSAAPERSTAGVAGADSDAPPATAADGPPRTPTEPLEGLVALPDDRFLDRELSWLDFNARVLTLAEDPTEPLLERAKVLAIFASNLDEFYMVRVAGLKRRLQTGLPVRSGQSLRDQLDRIAARAGDLVDRHARCFLADVLPALEDNRIALVTWAELTEDERTRLRGYFRDRIFPVLTPLAVDPAHPFPYISGLSLNLAVLVRDPDGGPELFARVKVPNNVPRLVRAAAGRYLPLEELIAAHLGELFSGMQIVEHHVFRVTRNAEVELDDDRDEDLLQALERELARRRFGPPVRLEVAATVSEHVLELLVRELEVDEEDVLRIPGPLDLSALWQVYNETDRPELKHRPFVPATHPRFAEGEVPRSVFATLRDGDILVHHPYHSFSTSVQRFIEQAAADPNVLAIKQTLYRTSGDSPVVDALVDAAEAGKQVVVIVEIKARFDEVANIGWARTLEKAGCHVVYGLVGLKTHCKTALVVRQEGDRIRRYAHIGTGNYHPKTARLYEDFGLLTADPAIAADLTDLFNVLTGYSRQTGYRRLLVAPHGVRSGIVERIDEQAELAAAGRPALVQIKVNSLVDEEVIDALYRASTAGVQVDLVVRGICTLRPGVPGLSENIRVRSILGRFLEHSRIFRFGTGPVPGPDGVAEGEPAQVWIGSADLMHRNLDRRVEALVQVTDPTARTQVEDVLRMAMAENTGAFELLADGSWRSPGVDADPAEHLQASLLRQVTHTGTH